MDTTGITKAIMLSCQNPKGFLNNVCPRIPEQVT